MTKEQFDTAREIMSNKEDTQARIRILNDMDDYEYLEVKHPSVGQVVIKGEIKATVLRLIKEDEWKVSDKLDAALEAL